MTTNVKECTKVWVPPEEWVPPESYISPPISQRIQILPLEKVPWESFQRLCARLAQRCGNVERCQEYGLPGQKQEGIDIYVRKLESSKFSVWQCKRYKEISPSQIKKAVSVFLDGSWVSKTDEFVLAVSVEVENSNLVGMIEVQASRLRKRNIRFQPLGIKQISERLKFHPDLIDDFFGREWVRKFCGQKAAEKLSSRPLRPEQVIRLRQLLRQCYSVHFELTDPGIPSLSGFINSDFRPLLLVDRFVPPEILEERQFPQTETFSGPSRDLISQQSHANESEDSSLHRRTRAITRKSSVRHSAIEWLSDSDRSVILGDPGIGKSTLLRCVLLDLLSTEPRYEKCARRWGQYLPVWVPFAMWTRLVGQSETGCSLSDVLKVWLLKVSADEDLIKLVQASLKDSRLLLFIDGLDEWNDVTTARTTLHLLEQFVGERKVPAIASSRPLGYESIGELSSKWRKSRLVGLSKEQQCILSERWFLHQLNALASPNENNDSIAARQKKAAVAATEHIQDLSRDFRLSRLAEVPLLLNGLIALAIQKISLPRSRFKAYEELTRLLMEEQPKRREKAAYKPRATTRLRQETRERALALLAWEIHDSSGSDALDKTAAQNVLQNFCSEHLYKSADEAFEVASELLAIGTESVGILIEKSSTDIGFLHRAFQEFLAAKHLSNLPFEIQKEAVAERFENPQWHDVFLCLCHLNTRADEVDDFVSIVKKLDLPTEMELARQSFLAEIAFGDLHCSAKVARRLSEEMFEIIETGVYEPTRKRLVELALDGLESDALRAVVESRIQRWYPLRHKYREGFYKSLTKWPRNGETRAILWRGLLDETEWNKRVAAESLAKHFNEDPSVGKRLLDLLVKPADPRLQAYVLHALSLGWKTNRRLTGILNDARFSIDRAIQSVALIHRVKRNEHDFEDREILMNLLGGFDFDSRHWQKDRTRALIAGWPGDTEVKHKAIKSVAEHSYFHKPFAPEASGIILLEGFPRDDEVAKVIAGLFRTRDFPGFELGLHSDWRRFVEVFAGNQELGSSVDDWIERKIKRKKQLFWEYQLCLISRSTRAKGYLLKADDESGVITDYQAQWLLEGWGMQDDETAVALTKFAKSGMARGAAQLLPDILEDKDLCRQQLLTIFRNESGIFARNALVGLIKLGTNVLNAEVVEAAINEYSGTVPTSMAFAGISDLIAHFPRHPSVRDLALYQLHSCEGDINTVANVYSSDDEIRCELFDLGSPLPAHLRSIVVDRLVRLAPEDDFAYGLLSDYDDDTNGNVKTAAAIGYVNSVDRRSQISSDLINKLSKDLCVFGLDLESHCQAAFSALLELNRLDIVKSVLSIDKMSHRLGLHNPLETNHTFAAQLTRRWDRISREFGESFLEQVGTVSDEFLTEMAVSTTDPDLLDMIIDKPKSNDPVLPSSQMLQLCAQHWRGTSRLRELCLTCIRDFQISTWISTAPRIVAAEIIAEQFASDINALTMLESLVTQPNNSSALVIALSQGPPNSKAWRQLSEQVKMSDLLLPAQIYLLATNAPPNEFVADVSTIMSKFRGDIWEFLPSCSRAAAIRFANDNHVCEIAFSRLERQPTSFEKMNFPYFLLNSDKQSERLRAWIRSEIKHQTESASLAEIALDLSTGKVRSVCHVLLEYLIA